MRRCLYCQKPATGTVRVAILGRGNVCAQCHVDLVVQYGRDRVDYRPGFPTNPSSWTGD